MPPTEATYQQLRLEVHQSDPANFLNPFNMICPVQSPPPKINRVKRRARKGDRRALR